MPNRSSKPKRPRDPNQLAKSIVDIATGEAQEEKPDAGKDPAAVALGRKGGLKGGKARDKKLSAQRKSEIAKKAAHARWEKSKKQSATSSVSAHPGKRKHVIQSNHED